MESTSGRGLVNVSMVSLTAGNARSTTGESMAEEGQRKLPFKCSNPKCNNPRFGQKSKCWRCLFLDARWRRSKRNKLSSPKAIAAEIGKHKSEAKSEAARENGKLGGRPKKQP